MGKLAQLLKLTFITAGRGDGDPGLGRDESESKAADLSDVIVWFRGLRQTTSSESMALIRTFGHLTRRRKKAQLDSIRC